ncbi:MAG: Rieske (2Fe-2S) protein [Mariprofundaceae bacterium]
MTSHNDPEIDVCSWQSINKPSEGKASCFQITKKTAPEKQEAFIIQYQGRLHAYVNRCPHAGSPLDWLPGQFFSEDGQTLVCHTHFAQFDPQTGACLAGPCPAPLTQLPLRIDGDTIAVPFEYE